jgi:hypothetical protein
VLLARDADPAGNGPLTAGPGTCLIRRSKIINRLLFVLCAGFAAPVPVHVLAQEPAKPVEKPAEKAPHEQCPRGAVGDLPESLRMVQNETDGTAFYRHQTSPPTAGEEAFFLYIGKKACDVWLRIRIQFPGNKPAGASRIRIKADDKSYEFPARRLAQSEDANARGFWYDELVEPDHLLMLFKVAASRHAAVRIESAGGAEEHVVSEREKQALTIVLGAYHSLGGKLSSGLDCRTCTLATVATASAARARGTVWLAARAGPRALLS